MFLDFGEKYLAAILLVDDTIKLALFRICVLELNIVIVQAVLQAEG